MADAVALSFWPVPEKRVAAKPSCTERIRKIVSRRKGVSEKRMFGGDCFLLNGNMACGVTGEGDLMLRLGEDGASAALDEPHTREMDFTGRSMKTMVFIEPRGYATDTDLKQWVVRSLDFAKTLPKKAAKKK
jgi:TfoX/Sxy family transcriptional regulator of competence genes